MDKFIAHTESKHRNKFACEHAACTKFGTNAKQTAKNASFLYISLLLGKNYIKKRTFMQREKQDTGWGDKVSLDNERVLSIIYGTVETKREIKWQKDL